MSRVANPYFAGPPATQPETFFGRQDVLKFVNDTLASPMHNVMVFHGQRRIGKTSILHQIARRNNEEYQAVFFDLQSSVERPEHELLYGLAREIAGYLNVSTPAREDFEKDSEIFRTQFLPPVLSQLGQRRLLLLLDEFDTLSLDTGTPDELDAIPFVQTLNRIIQSNQKRVVFLFVVGRRLKDLSAQQLQIFRGALDRQITLLQQEACLNLITQPAQDILKFKDSAVERIWTLTSGHPYFAQLLCHKIFNQAHDKNTWMVSEDDVDAVIDDAISAGQSALQWFWDEVPPVERFTLYTIGQLAHNGDGVSLKQLIAQRDTHRVQVTDNQLKALPDRLADRQVLKRDQNDHYHFAVDLVRRWILQSHSMEEVTSELTRGAVNEAAKAFFRAGLEAYRGNDMDFALESFSRALLINADYVEARLWLARTRLKKNDLLGAIDEFTYVNRFGGREAREAQVGLADARAQYGQQLEAEDKIEEATQQYQLVIELDEQHALANTRFSEIFLQQADKRLEAEGIEAAQPLYEQAVKHKTNTELEHKIRDRLDAYSQTQEKANNWEEAEGARRLYATLMKQAEGSQEALQRTQLEWARYLLTRHELERITGIYQRLLADTNDDTARQMIENDILRYSQQEEEAAHWSRVEEILGLLLELFPDDLESQNRLTDSLCRQGQYYLNKNDLETAKSAYRRALEISSGSQSIIKLIKDDFQAYRHEQEKDLGIESQQFTEAAMAALVELLGQDDAEVYEWLFTARIALGDALYVDSKLNRAHTAYVNAYDDVTYWLQLGPETSQRYLTRANVGLKLGQVELERGAFNEAADCFRQVLIDGNADPHMANQVKITCNEYRLRQEQDSRWAHAARAMEMLARLLHSDEEVNFWLAETRAGHVDWHLLQRAIPDLETARPLAREAIEVNLTYNQQQEIAARLTESFECYCEQQQTLIPPNWNNAEAAMNSLMGLFPGDVEVQRQLANVRANQGDWHLEQAAANSNEATDHLTQAAHVYRRALNDFRNDKELTTRLKDSFRDYRNEHLNQWRSNAYPAVEILILILPHDEEIQQWLDETTPKEKKFAFFWPPKWYVAVPAIIILLLIIGGVGVGGFGLFSSPIPTATAKPVVVIPSATPTPEPATETPTSVPPTATPTPTATSKTVTSTPPTATPTPTIPIIVKQPILLYPANDTVFEGNSPPNLQWDGKLLPDDRYRVKLTAPNMDEPYYSAPITTTNWPVPAKAFDDLNLLTTAPEEREVGWQVQVVQERQGKPPEVITTTTTQTFTWEPDPLPEGEVLDVAINPNNPKDLLVVLKGNSIYKSMHGGLYWEHSSPEPADNLHIAPANPNIIYAGGYGYVLRYDADNPKQGWVKRPLLGPDKVQVHDITTAPDNPDLVFVATESGVLRSENGGETWLGLEQAKDGEILNIRFNAIVAAGKRIYAAGKGNRIYWRTTDDPSSNTWETLVCNDCDDPISSLTATIDDEDENSIRVYAGSKNNKFNWWNQQEGWHKTMPIPVGKLTTAKLTALFVSSSGVIYAGSTDGDGLYYSSDMGKSWKPVGATQSWNITDVVLYNNRIIFIVASKHMYFSYDDDGTHWEELQKPPA